MSRCMSEPDATSLHHCLKNKQLKLKSFSGMDPANRSIMHSYFEILGKYFLFTKYLTSTNMPTAQQKKGHKKVLVPHCPDKKEGISPTLLR